MFAEIKAQFINGLNEEKWMDSATRAQARLKASEWKDFATFWWSSRSLWLSVSPNGYSGELRRLHIVANVL